MKKATTNQSAEKKKRGGVRPGSGRPVTGHKRYMLSLPPDLMERVKEKASESGKSQSGIVTDAVRAYLCE